MKTYVDLINSWIDCDGSKVYRTRRYYCTCKLFGQGMLCTNIKTVIDHIRLSHKELYDEYRSELARVDDRILQDG